MGLHIKEFVSKIFVNDYILINKKCLPPEHFLQEKLEWFSLSPQLYTDHLMTFFS